MADEFVKILNRVNFVPNSTLGNAVESRARLSANWRIGQGSMFQVESSKFEM